MALRFEACCQGECPEKAVVACQDDDGMDLLVGRAPFKGGMHPGKLNPSHSSLYVSYGGEEVPMQEYEILIQEGRDNLHWVEAKNGEVPPAALKIGYEANGDPLFVARGKVEKDSCDENFSMSVGKMNPRYGLAYLPYGGKEIEVAEYEVLCLKPICDLC